MAVIASGHAALACSFIVPQNPQASFRLAGIAGFVVLLVRVLVIVVSGWWCVVGDGMNALSRIEAKQNLAHRAGNLM
jgi:hypothetical protein